MPDDDITLTANEWRAILVLLGGTIPVHPPLRNLVYDKVVIAASKAMAKPCEQNEPAKPNNITKPPY